MQYGKSSIAPFRFASLLDQYMTADRCLPLRAINIMLAKVWANALAIVAAAALSLRLVVKGLLEVPITGSVPLFMVDAVLYLFSPTSLGSSLPRLRGRCRSSACSHSSFTWC